MAIQRKQNTGFNKIEKRAAMNAIILKMLLNNKKLIKKT